MAARHSPSSSAESSAESSRGGRGGALWRALGWLIFVAWLALLALNAAPYLSGHRMPPASDLPGRLVALPAALPLPATLAAPAAWTIAALALFIGVISVILTFSPGPRTAPVPPPLAEVQAGRIGPPPLTPPAPPPLAGEGAGGRGSPPPAVLAPPPLAGEQAGERGPAPLAVLAPPPLAGEGAGGRGPRIFISHSSGDDDFGRKLERALKQALGDDDAVFYDSDGGLIGGDEWPEQLQLELGQRDVFVLILSPRAAGSPWVRKEWNYALMRATSIGGKVIVPVMYEETPLWPFLADIQVIDFTDSERFEAAFTDLLVAVRLGRSRQAALEGLRGARRGPPFDVNDLPLVDRFIGRDADIRWALERLAPDLALESRRVVDIGNGRLGSGMASIAATNGLAGIGKSALAGALARMLYATDRYPDGIAVVACNDITDPANILRRALARFDPEEKEPPEQTVAQLSGLAKQVFARLPRALVILDNIEPQLDIAQVTKPLRVAGAALLLTSRQRLSASAVPAADSRDLGLLSLDEAVEVFLENRQRESQPADAAPSDADRAAIAEIVEALGRHTLAVKLAAPRSRGRDLARLAEEYATNPRLGLKLRDGTEAVDVVMSSSVAALPDHARQLFAALGGFASLDIGRAALLAVGEQLGDPDAAASLDALLDLRLVDAALDATLPADADRERLRLHPLTRAFARDLLDGERAVAGDPPWPAERRAQVERAVAAWYADYANATPDEALLPDEANIGGALAWAAAAGEDRLLARLANGLKDFWRNRSRTEARKAWLEPAVAASRRVAAASDARNDHLLAANLEHSHGELLELLGDLSGARSLFERSLEARVKYSDLRNEGVARSLLGDLARQAGDLPTARDAYTRYLAIMQQVGDLREEGVARSLLGDLALQAGDLPTARDAYTRYLAIMQQVGDLREEGVARSLLGDLALQAGDLPTARDAYTRYLEIMQQVGDLREEGVARSKLGDLALQAGDLPTARDAYQRAVEIMRQVGDLRGEGAALGKVGDLARQAGDLPTARDAYTRFLEIMQQVGAVRSEGVALVRMAAIAEQLDDLQQAEANYRQAHEGAKRTNSPPDIADTQFLLGRFLVQHGRGFAEGRRMLGEAAAIYAKLGSAWAGQERRARSLLAQLDQLSGDDEGE